jgi:hypothetical protein
MYTIPKFSQKCEITRADSEKSNSCQWLSCPKPSHMYPKGTRKHHKQCHPGTGRWFSRSQPEEFFMKGKLLSESLSGMFGYKFSSETCFVHGDWNDSDCLTFKRSIRDQKYSFQVQFKVPDQHYSCSQSYLAAAAHIRRSTGWKSLKMLVDLQTCIYFELEVTEGPWPTQTDMSAWQAMW